MSTAEAFPGEGVASGKQHGDVSGHLPARNDNMTLVSKLQVQPRNAGLPGRIADVAALGTHAYLTAFRDPTCERGGVHVVDISDPKAPKERVGAFIPTSSGSYAGEGIKVFPMANASFTGDVLIFQNESCGTPKRNEGSGGISLYDVTKPNSPKPLALHQGDLSIPGAGTRAQPTTVHSFDVWTIGGRTYAALVDNEEATDVDIMDITDPRRPKMINDTLDLTAATRQDSPDNLTSIFSHDMDVKIIDGRAIMALNYWDGGYVLLDVTDPRPGKVVILANSTYAELDEQRLERGQEIAPEGNAHQSELSRDNDFMIGTDEDFNPFRVAASFIPAGGTAVEFDAAQASGTPPLTEDVTAVGATRFVGLACNGDPLAPADDMAAVAIVERGACAFQDKLDNITAAGYTAGIVFNSSAAGCLTLVTMLAEGEIPFIFVDRSVGLQLLGGGPIDGTQCASPAIDHGTAAVDVAGIFSGWGYVRQFGVDLGDGNSFSGALDQVDTYAVAEAQDVDYAVGFGDLSVHEVAMDEQRNDIAYLSYYAAGIRAVQFDEGGMTEIGAFIDEGGSNFWGVEIHRIKGKDYLLASDRDFGLYIFETLDP